MFRHYCVILRELVVSTLPILYNDQQMHTQFTPGNTYQEGQQEDQRHAGGLMLEKIYRR